MGKRGGGGMQRVKLGAKQLRHMNIVIALVITTSNILLFVL